jgi:large subunit ribosomal protein L18
MRLRKKVAGTSARPRMSVFVSAKHMYVQIIDDDKGHTVAVASTLDAGFKEADNTGINQKSAGILGEMIARNAKDKGVETVVFDRGGFKFHGKIKALADAAREAGLKF